MKLPPKLLWPFLGLVTIGLGGLAIKVPTSGHSPAGSARRIAFYQDSMHPWIKAAQPGKCTICAMDLTPIYDGSEGFAVGANQLALSSNSVTVLNVQTAEIRRRPLRRTVRVAGALEANETSKRVISASRDGRVERLAVPYAGFEVTKGEPLANYFIPELLAEARRYVFLAQSGSQGPRSSIMDMSNPVLSTLQNLRLYGFTEEQIENLARTGKAEGSFDILSPATGTVIERNVSEGQYVSQGTRLFTIVDLSVLWFRFDVYEQDLYWLQPGQLVEFTVPSAPGRVFSGPIKFIEPFINETTRSAKVRVDVDNPLVKTGATQQRELRQQQYAEGWAHVVKSNLLVVPATAILYPGHQAYAYVDQGSGSYQMRQVKLGRRGDQEWEILSGLAEGEQVVVTGNVLMDAQAQFNKGGGHEASSPPTPAAEHHLTGDSVTGLTQPQQAALSKLLEAADGVSKALAADSLEQLQRPAENVPKLVAALARELGHAHEWQSLVAGLQEPSQSLARTDLAAARTAFLPFSTRMVELVQLLRTQGEPFRTLKVFHCPMAPKPGLWFQAQGPLRNPYYGAEMLTCGEEIKRTAVLPKAPPPVDAPPAVVAAAPALPAVAVPATPAIPPPTAPGRSFGKLTTGASAEVQSVNSRDHAAFKNRMDDALAARFGRGDAGATNGPAPIPARRSAMLNRTPPLSQSVIPNPRQGSQ